MQAVLKFEERNGRAERKALEVEPVYLRVEVVLRGKTQTIRDYDAELGATRGAELLTRDAAARGAYAVVEVRAADENSPVGHYGRVDVAEQPLITVG